ncbi:MAG TPA: ribose 5-phosphate isomerase B [Candidatus Acidoferrum sp.]|nr:ribose 5-phosphate isomerase B [Candidatus Acidoferrum sp.]
MKWIVGADHAGVELKRRLVEMLRRLGDEVEDLGTHSTESVDYPDYAVRVARKVVAGEGRGLLVCGTGVGMAMAANKVAGVRAAVVTDAFTARVTRAHNDANVMAVGERVVGIGVAEEALRAFRDTPFEGGRHALRVAKVDQLDRGR